MTVKTPTCMGWRVTAGPCWRHRGRFGAARGDGALYGPNGGLGGRFVTGSRVTQTPSGGADSLSSQAGLFAPSHRLSLLANLSLQRWRFMGTSVTRISVDQGLL